MVIVFDMDDTLYPEITYVYSGFKAVSDYISSKSEKTSEDIFEIMKAELKKNGRGKVFDNALKFAGIYSKASVKKCLSVYRSHDPVIELSSEAAKCLNRLKQFPLYVVTDGNKIVQTKKAEKLGLNNFVKKVFVSHAYGLDKAKPSSYLFNKIADIENEQPENIVYIGDNPNKDFVGIKPLGFITIRIVNGMFADLRLDENNEAHVSIESLDVVDESFLLNLGMR